MIPLQTVKFYSFFGSILVFTVFIGGSTIIDLANKTEELPIKEFEIIDEFSIEPIPEEAIIPSDCKGIINAYEGQIGNDPDKLPPSLSNNYKNCLEFGTPNATKDVKEEKVKKEKKK